jgi:hypothetical protein
MMMGTTRTWTHTCSNCNATIAVRGEHGEIEVKEPMPSRLVPSKFGAANASMVEGVPPVKNSERA